MSESPGKSESGNYEVDSALLQQMIGFSPHPAQRQIIDGQKRFTTVMAGRQMGKCQNILSPVRCQDGSIKMLKDISVGDKVVKGNGLPGVVMAIEPPHKEKTLKLVLRSGREVEVTPEHRLLSEYGYIETGKLKIGDHIGCLWDYKADGGEKISDDDAKLLGYLIGDGSVTLQMEFAKANEKILSDFRLICDLKGWKRNEKFRNGAWHIKVSSDGEGTTLRWMEKYGIRGFKSKEKTIPKIIWTQLKRTKALFLSRLFGCDSSISFLKCNGNPVFEYCSASKELSKGVQILLGELGIASRIREKDTKCQNEFEGKAWLVSVSSKENMEKLLTVCPPYGKDKQNEKAVNYFKSLDLSLPRQDNVPKTFSALITTEDAKRIFGLNARQRKGYCMSRWKWREIVKDPKFQDMGWVLDYYWDPIESIEESGAMVMDIQVDGGETFLIGDIVSHNSLLVSYLVLEELFHSSRQIWIVAPNYNLTERIFKNYLLPIVNKYPKDFKVSLDKYRIESIATGSSVECKSAENPVGLLGATLDLMVMDEAAEISEEMFERYLRPTLMVKKGRCFLISTPTTRSNWFFGKYLNTDNDPEWASFHFTSYDNPFVTADELDKIKKKTPSDVWRQQYLAEPVADGGKLFTDTRAVINGELSEPEHGQQRYILGWDPARVHDYSVIIVVDRKTKNVVHFDRFSGIDWSLQIERVIGTAHKYNDAIVIMDATSQGDPLCEALKKSIYTKGYPIYVDPYKIDTNQKKKELIENLVVMIQNWEISYPFIEELVKELENYTYIYSQYGNVKYTAPKGMFDDTVVALALACFELKKMPYLSAEEAAKDSSQNFTYQRVY